MPGNENESYPDMTDGSNRRAAQLRPVRLAPSAYPSNDCTSATGVEARDSTPSASTTAQSPVLSKKGTAGVSVADFAERHRAGRTLYTQLEKVYWEEDGHQNKFVTYGTAGGPKGVGSETRREAVSKLMESFCVYNKLSSENEGRDDLTRAQAEEDWNRVVEEFLDAVTQETEG